MYPGLILSDPWYEVSPCVTAIKYCPLADIDILCH